jgi:hypothetical protein
MIREVEEERRPRSVVNVAELDALLAAAGDPHD